MFKFFINFIPSLVVCIILVFLGFKIFYNLDQINSQNDVLSVLIDKTAPNIMTNNLNNDEKPFIINEETKGPYLLNFFSSWCVPCQYEAPYLNELSNRVDIYGIVYKDKINDTNKFLKSFGNQHSILKHLKRHQEDQNEIEGLPIVKFGVASANQPTESLKIEAFQAELAYR